MLRLVLSNLVLTVMLAGSCLGQDRPTVDAVKESVATSRKAAAESPIPLAQAQQLLEQLIAGRQDFSGLSADTRKLVNTDLTALRRQRDDLKRSRAESFAIPGLAPLDTENPAIGNVGRIGARVYQGTVTGSFVVNEVIQPDRLRVRFQVEHQKNTIPMGIGIIRGLPLTKFKSGETHNLDFPAVIVGMETYKFGGMPARPLPIIEAFDPDNVDKWK